jgi:hypothetical protein
MTSVYDVGGKEVRITLNKGLYDGIATKTAIKDFSRVCRGKFICGKNVIIVTLNPYNKKIIQKLGYEFCNYILGLMKNKGLFR